MPLSIVDNNADNNGSVSITLSDGSLWYLLTWPTNPNMVWINNAVYPMPTNLGVRNYKPDAKHHGVAAPITVTKSADGKCVFKTVATPEKYDMTWERDGKSYATSNGTMTKNGLPNPKTNGKFYYGNSTPVTKKPVQINLINVPLSQWNLGVQYHYNLCGYSSECKDFTRDLYPYSDAGLAIESPPIKQNWVQFGGRGNCPAGQGEAWCIAPIENLTHVFGQGTDIGTILDNNKQYGPMNALDLQITPFNKVLNSSDGTIKGMNPEYRDTMYFSNNKNRPMFKSLSFNLPDPTELNLDSKIPHILVGYFNKGMLDITQLNNYLSKYAFTSIKDQKTNKIIPRYAVSDGLGILPNVPIDLWKLVSGNTFERSSLAYCSDKTLNTDWCNTYCNTAGNNCDTNIQAFCKTPGTGILPSYTNNGKLPTIPVTQKILDDAYPNYSLFPEVCGCNMPTPYYQQLDIKSFQEMGDAGPQAYQLLFNQGGVGGRPNCDPLTVCKAGGRVLPNRADLGKGNCPSINIQNCIQNNSTSMDNGQGNTNINNQTISCLQNVSNTTNAAPSNNPTALSSPTPAPAQAPTPAPTPASRPAPEPASTSAPEPASTSAPEPASTPASADSPAPADLPKKPMSPAMMAIIVFIVLLIFGGGFVFLKK